MRYHLALILLLGAVLILSLPPQEGYSSGIVDDETAGAQVDKLAPRDTDEVLWLARCIYSESNRADEQHLVAWVVRNRVETSFRGDTYRDVVLEDRQFSAFNTPTARRERILRLSPSSQVPGWQEALSIALDVYQAPASERPFPQTTRHFYSPISIVGRSKPTWARQEDPVQTEELGIDPSRFQFFAGLDANTLDTPATNEKQTTPGRRHRRSVTVKSMRSRLRARSGGQVSRPTRPAVPRPQQRNR